jgi:glycosidase
MWLLAVIAACCRGDEAPELIDPGSLSTDVGVTLEIPLAQVAPGIATEDLAIVGSEHLDAVIADDRLRLVPEPGWEGIGTAQLTAWSACDAAAVLDLSLVVGDFDTTEPPIPDDLLCPTVFVYDSRSGPAAVALAGSFNDWDASADPMSAVDSDTWSLTLDLAPGAYPYKLVEQGSEDSWTCNPDGAFFQCDEGTPFDADCALGAGTCNSMRVVPDCRRPTLAATSVDIDRDNGSLEVVLSWQAGVTGAALASNVITLNGEAVAHDLAGGEVLRLTGLISGRHTLRVQATDEEGFSAEPLYLPFWTDDRSWETGVLYYAFVDRFANGDTGRDGSEGTSLALTDYLGGDWAGLTDRLDYLVDLGVTAIWLTAPQDNPPGPWGDDCGEDYSGYHGYWPASPDGLEEHFGDESDFRELIDEAHARGLRVLTDWVGNHVHTDHPWWQNHPEWFNDPYICDADEDNDGVSNWDQRPETCWFDAFLPDIRYYDVEPLVEAIDEAMDFLKKWELDGYRVDAVKHMPHSVYANLQARILAEVEHEAAGGDEEFYTVGETYTTDRGLVGAYIGDAELDAQFDFPLYFDILSHLGRNEGEIWELEEAAQASEIEFHPATMSTFLGNHDVERFIAQAEGSVNSLYGDGTCPDGDVRIDAEGPDWDEPYERLRMAWTWLFTRGGLPLVYYGDEYGQPGYADPDNRQFMRFPGALSEREAATLAHVCILANARAMWPVLATGSQRNWMGYDPLNGFYQTDLLAWTRIDGAGGQMLVALNRDDQEIFLRNTIEWAGLKPGSEFVDLITGEAIVANGDLLEFVLGARSTRVLVSPADVDEVADLRNRCWVLASGD